MVGQSYRSALKLGRRSTPYRDFFQRLDAAELFANFGCRVTTTLSNIPSPRPSGERVRERGFEFE
jgi:hypothetical protein